MGLIIRDGRPADLDALERLENDVFDGDRLSRRSLRYYLTAPTTAAPVAEIDGRFAGYAMIGFRATSRIGRIFSLAVDRGHARRGVGRALLGACEAAARRRGRTCIQLEVRPDNPAAIALYETHGFVRFGEIEEFYEDGATALQFEKPLGASLADGAGHASVRRIDG